MAGNIETKLPDGHAKENVGLKLLLELGPLLVFFFANAYGERLSKAFPMLNELGGPLFIATGLFATVISLVASKIIVGKLPLMPLVSGVVVLVFGGLSIWLQNETFIKMKPTIINSLFAVVLLGGLLFGKSMAMFSTPPSSSMTQAGTS
jgi:intracellular septation protein